MDLNDPTVLASLGRQIRADVLRTHLPNSCIYTTATTVNLLRHLGADAYALSVRAVIANAALARIIDERGIEHVSHDDPDVRAAGGYGVGLGYPPAPGEAADPPGSWPGHLVAILNRRWLLDFSADQASRPQHGIDLSDPIVAPVDEPFLRGRETRRFMPAGADGTSMRIDYHAYPTDRTYRESPDWRRGTKREINLRTGQ